MRHFVCIVERRYVHRRDRALLFHPPVAVRFCPSCNAEVSGTTTFCTNCGQNLGTSPQVAPTPASLQCINCGRQNAPDVRFCGGCGAQLGGAPYAQPGYTPIRSISAISQPQQYQQAQYAQSHVSTAAISATICPGGVSASAYDGSVSYGVALSGLYGDGSTWYTCLSELPYQPCGCRSYTCRMLWLCRVSRGVALEVLCREMVANMPWGRSVVRQL